MALAITFVSRLFGLLCVYAIRFVSSDDNHDSDKENDQHEENCTDHGYGTEWLRYYVNGTTHMINFSVLPEPNVGWRNGTVYFYLYTRSNPDDPELLRKSADNSHIESQYFNASKDTEVLTHGWLSNGNMSWIQDTKTNYLAREDANVIIVDWGELAENPSYPVSAVCTRYVGKRLAKLLDCLVESNDAKGEQMHLTGHSLGAHVMGYAGMFFSSRIFRITGLDPARPLFEIPDLSDDFRLDKSDAEYVDIIHTSAGHYGYLDSRGQADYYPNGGRTQPGCEGTVSMAVSCSHGRSHEYFKESLQGGEPFTAYPCESYEAFKNGECKNGSSHMGEPARPTAYRDYYMNTSRESPYALGDEF